MVRRHSRGGLAVPERPRVGDDRTVGVGRRAAVDRHHPPGDRAGERGDRSLVGRLGLRTAEVAKSVVVDRDRGCARSRAGPVGIHRGGTGIGEGLSGGIGGLELPAGRFGGASRPDLHPNAGLGLADNLGTEVERAPRLPRARRPGLRGDDRPVALDEQPGGTVHTVPDEGAIAASADVPRFGADVDSTGGRRPFERVRHLGAALRHGCRGENHALTVPGREGQPTDPVFDGARRSAAAHRGPCPSFIGCSPPAAHGAGEGVGGGEGLSRHRDGLRGLRGGAEGIGDVQRDLVDAVFGIGVGADGTARGARISPVPGVLERGAVGCRRLSRVRCDRAPARGGREPCHGVIVGHGEDLRGLGLGVAVIGDSERDGVVAGTRIGMGGDSAGRGGAVAPVPLVRGHGPVGIM